MRPVILFDFACPDEAAKARVQVRAYAHEMHGCAQQAQADALVYEEAAARASTFNEISTNEEVIRFRDLMVEGGLIKLEVPINGPGGVG